MMDFMMLQHLTINFSELTFSLIKKYFLSVFDGLIKVHPGEDANNNRVIDFRNLLYDDDMWSKILYMFLLGTSLTSVGTSLAKVSKMACQLKINPNISIIAFGFWEKTSDKENSFFSIFKAAYVDYNKVLDTKLLNEHHCEVGFQNHVRRNFHLINFRGFLYHYIYEFQFSPELLKISEVEFMKERYFRGICAKFKIKNPEQFCKTELMTFTEATIYAPITIIVFTFFPHYAYLTFCSIKFYGWRNWVSGVLDNPIYYIFSMFTNISFYEYVELETTVLLPSLAPEKTMAYFGNRNMKEDLKKSLIDVPTLIVHCTTQNEEEDRLTQKNEMEVREVNSLERESEGKSFQKENKTKSLKSHEKSS